MTVALGSTLASFLLSENVALPEDLTAGAAAVILESDGSFSVIDAPTARGQSQAGI